MKSIDAKFTELLNRPALAPKPPPPQPPPAPNLAPVNIGPAYIGPAYVGNGQRDDLLLYLPMRSNIGGLALLSGDVAFCTASVPCPPGTPGTPNKGCTEDFLCSNPRGRAIGSPGFPKYVTIPSGLKSAPFRATITLATDKFHLVCMLNRVRGSDLMLESDSAPCLPQGAS